MTGARHRAASVLRAVTLAALVCIAPVAPAADADSDGIHLHPALAGIDWSGATEIEIALQDHHYEPEQISLKRGQPYRLVLKNVGAVAHDMVGGSLLNESVIALRMVNSNAGRVLADYVNSVYVRSRNSIELWLVPLKEGEYSFYCSLPGHRDDGMEGVVRIIP